MINEELDKASIGYKSKLNNPVGVVSIGTFEWALMRVKEGAIIARNGWNGKGMYVALASRGKGKDVAITIEPFFIIKNTHNTFNTWVPSVSDLLAEDWEDVTELYSK